MSNIIFLTIFAIIFEVQKSNMARRLADFLSNDKGLDIFIFNNGKSFDPFENFLIVDNSNIYICSYYLPIQQKLNFLINKKLELIKIAFSDIQEYIIQDNNIELITKDYKHTFQNIPNVNVLEQKLHDKLAR